MNLLSELRESEINQFENTREILEACKNTLVNMSDNEKTAEIHFKHRIMIDLSFCVDAFCIVWLIICSKGQNDLFLM